MPGEQVPNPPFSPLTDHHTIGQQSDSKTDVPFDPVMMVIYCKLLLFGIPGLCPVGMARLQAVDSRDQGWSPMLPSLITNSYRTAQIKLVYMVILLHAKERLMLSFCISFQRLGWRVKKTETKIEDLWRLGLREGTNPDSFPIYFLISVLVSQHYFPGWPLSWTQMFIFFPFSLFFFIFFLFLCFLCPVTFLFLFLFILSMLHHLYAHKEPCSENPIKIFTIRFNTEQILFWFPDPASVHASKLPDKIFNPQKLHQVIWNW